MILKIKDLLIKNNKLVAQRINRRYLKKQGILEFIESFFDNSYSLLEKIYCLTHDLKQRKKCKSCEKEIKFNYGYATFCSKSCANNDIDVLNKNKQNVSISLKKAYKERGSLIKEKRSNTLKQKYNKCVDSLFAIDEIKEKIKQTNLKKYKVENVFYLKQFRADVQKISQTNSIIKNKTKGYDIIYLDKNKILIKNLCKIHGDVETDCITFYNRCYRNRNGIKCTICNPISSYSSLELEFEKILTELNIKNYLRNSKNIITLYELDFYFPDYKIAIELNGVYWHSEIYLDKDYHKNKTELCERNGIRLIHIWEDDFYNNRDLIKSMISILFNKINRKIYANECNIKNINSKTYKDFLNKNHIQKEINSSIKYGLYYNNELVSVMGFKKLRIPLYFELQRFCSKQNIIVIGGELKLLSYFEENIKYNKIITFVKRDYSNGDLYKKINFNLIKICNPERSYIINNERQFNIKNNNEFIKCFDSGKLKFEKTLN